MKICNSCNIEKPFSEFSKRSLSKDGLQHGCKSCRNELKKKYYDKDKQRERVNRWRRENLEKFRESKNRYQKHKRETEPLFKLKHNLTNRTVSAFKHKRWNKNTKTQKMLGADYNTVKNHIESRFKNGMTWDNYGEWQIDHIIPLASAKTEQELIQLCHYTNLQPLWFEENISKGNKIIACRINL